MSKVGSRGRKPSPRVLVGGSSISYNALSHERICKRWTDTPGAVLWTVHLQSNSMVIECAFGRLKSRFGDSGDQWT